MNVLQNSQLSHFFLVTVGIFLFALLGYQKDASLIEVFLLTDLGLSPN